ncbi:MULTISPECIES: ThiF family adenylyltransferase [unclassified Helicobacter]|uniref:ThiF family adenylyltransferase n=1 Tax=unclassified Helicobacter TaxID=2593540 RepID=UPI000AF65668|nr:MULTISPECIES: ThiF family adenylyltransferase [unclassified Helicobacter]
MQDKDAMINTNAESAINANSANSANIANATSASQSTGNSDRFARSRLLFDSDFDKIRQKRAIIFGVGGVGGFALDSLYRTGLGEIVIVDKDIFDATNQNRQIGSHRVGEQKVKVLEELYPGVRGVCAAVSEESIASFDIASFDYVIDAIDDIPAKVLLARECAGMRYGRFICSTGSAKKLNPLEIRVDNIWRSYGDKFARKLRDALKKQNLKTGYKVVFSPEPPRCKGLGSFSAVTASFGLQIASEVICDIIH